MLCPICNERGADLVGGQAPLERWRCRHCGEEYPVYQGYPVHPEAFAILATERVRCPVCGETRASQVTDAPDMGTTKVFRCPDCESYFPVLTVNPRHLGLNSLLLRDDHEYFLPVHPQAMIDTVTGIERLPTFFALTQRLREYVEHTGFTIARTEDRVDMDTQVREFAFFFVPDSWASEHPDRASAVQGAIGFTWHAGLAQCAGTPITKVGTPVPIAMNLSVMINPDMVARSLQAYLSLVAGLSSVLQTLALDESTVIEAEMAVAPRTQEATIQRLAIVRRLSLDLASSDQWTGLVMAMPHLQALLNQVWELVDHSQPTE